MKKHFPGNKLVVLICFIALPILLSINKTIYSQFYFGVNSGITYNGLTGDVPNDAVYKRKFDLSFGITTEYKFNNDIITGIGFGYYKTGTVISFDKGDKETKDSIDVSMRYVNIPLCIKILTGNKYTYFSSGLDLRMLVSADRKYIDNETELIDIKENLQKYNVSIFAGFGGIIPLGKANMGIELRYSHSLTNINSNIGNIYSGLPARFRLTGFQMIISFNYSLK